MNCEACGHGFYEHNIMITKDVGPYELSACSVCYQEPFGGPCFPWEFR